MKKMCVGPTSKLSKAELDRRRKELEATKEARREALRPHKALLEKIKALLSAESDQEAIRDLEILVDMTSTEIAHKAAAVANWHRTKKPLVLANMRSVAAA
jgi:hypothetical protein